MKPRSAGHLYVSRQKIMAAIFAFKCRTCDEVHEGSPSFAYEAPWHYSQLSDTEKSNAELYDDICVITDGDRTDRFIRVVLEVPIHGISEPFMWGVWVSLSEENFRRYLETWDNPDESDSYFGWFCNRLPYYPDTINLRTLVHPRSNGCRPYLELEPTEHPLAQHLLNGISVEQAQEIAECAAHNG